MAQNADKIVELTRAIDVKMADLEAMKARVDAEKRCPNEEERNKAAAIMKEVGDLSETLNLEKEELELRGKLNVSQRGPLKPELMAQDALQRQYPGLPPKELRFDSFGEQLLAIVKASNPSMGVDKRLMRALTGMNETFPSDGGFLVQTDFATGLINRVYEQSPLVSRVTKIPIGANSNGIKLNAVAETSRASSIWGGIILYWLGEGGTKTPSRPEFRQIELTLKKIAGLYYATDELLQDAAALESVAAQGFAQALDVELERVILRGSGAGQPMGILTSPALITQTAETGQLAATILAENIIKMWARLWSRSQSSAVWLVSQSVFPQLYTMGLVIGTAGFPLWVPPNGLAGSPNGTLMGRPIFTIENCSALGTVGDICLVDPTEYLLATKGGPQIASSIHVNFINDETCFRIVFRCDGQPAWNSPLTPKDASSTVGPFVVLATRS